MLIRQLVGVLIEALVGGLVEVLMGAQWDADASS